MFDHVPVRVWLLIAIAAVAYGPVRYIYRYLAHAPSRRDITQPSEDLSWRTSSQFARNLSILAALVALAAFIFTPAASQFARSPGFLPILIACAGAWALFTVPAGFVNGKIEPFIRGINRTYERKAQPKRFWASLAWNALFGSLCTWLAFESYGQASAQVVQDQCYNEHTAYSPREVILACDELIASRDSSRDRLSDYMGGRGIAYARLGDYRRAIADYSEAIRLDPRDSNPYYNRGLAYRKLGDTRRAIADYTAAVRLRPSDADAYLNRGLILLDTGKFDDAVADFTRAHELDPKDPWSLANRGVTYAWKSDQARAEKDFKAVRAIDPSNQVLLRGEALLSMKAGDMKTAVYRLTAALNREPDDRWSLGMRAEAYRRLGEHEKSRADANELLRLSKETKGAQPQLK